MQEIEEEKNQDIKAYPMLKHSRSSKVVMDILSR